MWQYHNKDIKCYFDIWSSATIGEIPSALMDLMEAVGEDLDVIDVDDRFEVDWTNSLVYTTYPEDLLNNPSDAVYDVLNGDHRVFHYDPRLTFARPVWRPSQ